MKSILGIVTLGLVCLSVPVPAFPDLLDSPDETFAAGFPAEFRDDMDASNAAEACDDDAIADSKSTEPAVAAVTNAEPAVGAAAPDVNAPIPIPADRRRDRDGSTALHEAAHFNQPDKVELLLAKGANINIANNIGITPLHLASLAGHSDMAALLLAHKADVNVRDAFGLTPLHMAAQYGHEKTMLVLIAGGARIESRTNTQGMTPLHWAAFWGHIEGVQCLLSSGGDINARDNTGNTPLTWAEAYGQHDMARLLARKGAKGHNHEKLYGLNASWHID